ncbi:hypothetical protein HAX54_017276, partial [Datura stramonium]|nr:hypothetical protein [Datura stramonium]
HFTKLLVDEASLCGGISLALRPLQLLSLAIAIVVRCDSFHHEALVTIAGSSMSGDQANDVTQNTGFIDCSRFSPYDSKIQTLRASEEKKREAMEYNNFRNLPNGILPA